ncbi:translocation/assembly module TamB domain-containing protein [Chelatococcus sp. GCM10030263]|uniref:translocation/assembly module TamB domain-containing protein n=1 Tax=Chelatococcus sp. GCM10030263 TaxID=3273387 RepID=UPI00360A55ED
MRWPSFPALRVVLTAIAGIIVLVGVGLVVLTRTDFGRAELARMVERLASSEGMTIRIGRLDGALPAEMRVTDVTVADRRGVWLSLDRADLSWHPLSLLSGRLDIRQLALGRLDVARAPESQPAPAAPAEPSAGLPRLPVGVAVEHWEVAHLALGAALVGAPAELALNGTARLVDPAQGLVAELQARRIDGTAGEARARLRYVPESKMLDVDVAASEPSGGLVSRLADLRGAPPVALTVTGSGTLDDWRGQLKLGLGDRAGAEGEAVLRREGAGRRLDVSLNANLGAVLPANVEPLAGPTQLTLAASLGDDGAVTVSRFTAENAALKANGSGSYAADGAVTGTAHVETAGSAPFAALLPMAVIADGSTAPIAAWQSVVADVTLGGTGDAPQVRLALDGRGVSLVAAGERYGAQALTLNATANGDGLLLAPATRFATTLSAVADGLSASDPAVAAALGSRLTLTAQGTGDRSGRVDVDNARIEAAPLVATYAGRLDAQALAGRLTIERADLAALRAIAQRDLGGEVRMVADVDAAYDLSRLVATLDGSASQLRTGIAQLDGLLGGQATVKGTVRRAADGSFGFETFSVDGAHASLMADGSATADRANVVAKIALPELQHVDPRLTGRGDVSATLTGSLAKLDGRAEIAIRDARAQGRPIERLTLDVTASDILKAPSGSFTLDGAVDGKPARGSGRFAREASGASRLEALDVTLGSVVVRGALAADPATLVTGQLAVTAGDLADLSPLLLTDLAGRLELMAQFDAADGKQAAHIAGSAARLQAFGLSLTGAKIDASGRDLWQAPAFNGEVTVDNAATGGVSLSRARLTAQGSGTTTDVTLNAVVQGADLAAQARITPAAGGLDAVIRQLTLSRGQRITLAPDARISLRNGTVTLSGVELASGSGRLTVEGSAGANLDIRATARALPLTLAELFVPGLGVTGALNGDVALSGPAAQPNGRYTITVSNLTASQIRDAGLRPLGITAQGTLAGGRVTVDARVTGLSGSNMQITGSAPLGAGNLDVGMNGRIDLGLLNARLSASGQNFTGQAIADLRIRGTAAAPAASGTVRIANGRFEDALNGVSFSNIEALITGSERELVISRLTARARNGGSVTGSGRVALDPAAGFPGSIAIRASNAQLMASPVVNATANADLTIAGALATRPTVRGSVDFSTLEITLPKRFPYAATPIDVRYVNAPPAVRARLTAERREEAAQSANPFTATLDIALSARSGIAVRGQGINAQLGGQVRLGGTSAAPQADGAFTLRRGTLSILGRQLTFTRGEVTLVGDFDPEIDFEAESTASGITARVLVTGKASAPKIDFSSSPELPRDEILARLLFGRPSGGLSTGQAIQLAQALAQLTGEGGGPLGTIGSSLGLDSIDLGTTNDDGSGSVAVGIGKQINDRMRFSIKQGATPDSSRAAIDLDLGRNIKLEAEAGTGGGAVGIGMEWNY